MPLEALPREILGAVSVGAVSTQGGARHASRRGQTGGVVAKPGTALTFCRSASLGWHFSGLWQPEHGTGFYCSITVEPEGSVL